MTVPPPWSSLTADEKRARVRAVADELFAREGLGVPMPRLAEAVGVGVGSLYRQVGAKEDVIAALVAVRAEGLRERFAAAVEVLSGAAVATASPATSPGGPRIAGAGATAANDSRAAAAWSALGRATHATVEDCLADALSQSAWDTAAATSAEARAARARATEALAALVASVRDAGALAHDASHEDLRLVFCALRELGGIGPEAAHRLAALVLRGMRAQEPASDEPAGS